MFISIIFYAAYFDTARGDYVYPYEVIDTDFEEQFETCNRGDVEIENIIRIYNNKALNVAYNLSKYFLFLYGKNPKIVIGYADTLKDNMGNYYDCVMRHLNKHFWIEGTKF